MVYHTGHNVLCAGTFTSAHELTIHSTTISFSSASNSKQARPLLSLVTLCHTYTRSPRGPNYLINHKFLNPAPLTQSQLPSTISSQERKGPHLQGSGPSATAHSNTKAKKRRKKKQHSLLSFSLTYLPPLSFPP